MKPPQDFTTFNLPTALVEQLSRLGFKLPTPIQETGIPTVLSGKDLLGVAPTGTGKTGAFGIPAIAHLSTQSEKQVLVIAPTRELAAQIFQFMRQLGEALKLHGVLLVGGESFRYQFSECRAGADYLVATPGRLMDHVEQGLDLSHVGILILDEVDRMLDMGFAPQVEEIIRRVPKERQTVFFSATMPQAIQKLAQRLLKDPVRVTVGQNPEDAPKIREERIRVSAHQKPELLLERIQASPGKILVFARTQRRAEQVVERLEASGIEAACLHGGRTQSERKLALDAFRRGRVRVLVATDIAARGIDVPDIELVVNFDPPATREDYLHRIGRTGRCGKEGIALTLIEDSRGSEPARRAPASREHFRRDPSPRAEDPRRARMGVQTPREFKSPSSPLTPPKSARPNTPFKPVVPSAQPQLKPVPPFSAEPPRRNFKRRETRANHSGTVRYFRAGDPAFVRPPVQPDLSLFAKKTPSAPNWVRSESNTVRRRKTQNAPFPTA
jgi:ATP-dependent RNA helicase RhlE